MEAVSIIDVFTCVAIRMDTDLVFVLMEHSVGSICSKPIYFSVETNAIIKYSPKWSISNSCTRIDSSEVHRYLKNILRYVLEWKFLNELFVLRALLRIILNYLYSYINYLMFYTKRGYPFMFPDPKFFCDNWSGLTSKFSSSCTFPIISYLIPALYFSINNSTSSCMYSSNNLPDVRHDNGHSQLASGILWTNNRIE